MLLNIYKYGVERRQALSLEAALVTPVTPRVIPNPRVRIVQDFIFFHVSAEVTRYKVSCTCEARKLVQTQIYTKNVYKKRSTKLFHMQI